MDILISHDGQQTGPHSDEEALALVQAGAVRLGDLAWRPGMSDWLPLHAVLGVDAPGTAASNAETAVPESHVPASQSEPATHRQRAYLTYLGIPFTSDLTKENAASLVNAAIKDPKNAERIKRWDRERLRLYPDLYAEELKAQKENRAQHFLDACQGEGAKYFDGITKAHTQVLVGYLDVHHPNWDQHEQSVEYFFAAVNEKFPQLVKKSAKAQLQYPEGSRIARDMAASRSAQRSKGRRSPVAAAVRGIAIGLLILGVLYGAKELYERNQTDVNGWIPKWAPSAESTAVESPVEATQEAPAVAEASEPAPKRRAKAKRAAAAATEAAAATSAPQTTEPARPAEAPADMTVAAAATPAPQAAAPAIPTLFEPAPTAATPATPAPRTSVTITKAISVPLRFGVSTLSAGTSVPLVSIEGTSAVVRFGPDLVRIPVAHTDLEPGR